MTATSSPSARCGAASSWRSSSARRRAGSIVVGPAARWPVPRDGRVRRPGLADRAVARRSRRAPPRAPRPARRTRWSRVARRWQRQGDRASRRRRSTWATGRRSRRCSAAARCRCAACSTPPASSTTRRCWTRRCASIDDVFGQGGRRVEPARADARRRARGVRPVLVGRGDAGLAGAVELRRGELVHGRAGTHRRARRLPASSINWGPWAEVGMAADLLEQEKDQELGLVKLIQAEQGLQILEDIIAASRCQITPLPFDITNLMQFNPGALSSHYFQDVVRSELQALGSATGSVQLQRPELDEEFVAPRNEIERTIASIWQRASASIAWGPRRLLLAGRRLRARRPDRLARHPRRSRCRSTSRPRSRRSPSSAWRSSWRPSSSSGWRGCPTRKRRGSSNRRPSDDGAHHA